MREMKKHIQERGITLVALVVTLVILLILAGITIATLFGENGIINKAQKAKEETEKSTKNELDALNSLEEEMENAINGNGWRQPNPLKPEITNGEITLKIGDYVDYDCTTSNEIYTSAKEKTGYTQDQVFKANAYNYGWRVLGIDKSTKQLQLISEDFVPLTGGGDRGNRIGQYYYLSGRAGYIYGEGELNKICSIYGNGKGAVTARSINVDDVNKITGYNPNNIGVKDPSQTGSGIKFGDGSAREYNNTVKYTLTSNGVKYEPVNGAPSGTSSMFKKFVYYNNETNEWKILEENQSTTLKSNVYSYYPTTLTETDDENAKVGIASTSAEYKMLFVNSSTGDDNTNIGNSNGIQYWLNSKYLCTENGYAHVGLRYINEGRISYNGLHETYEPNDVNYLGIRPVVTLSSEIQLKDSETIQDGCKLYNMEVK